MSSPSYEEIWSHPGKPLRDHLENVGEIALALAEAIPLKILNKPIFEEIVRLTGLYHDIGKATPFFQNYLREENLDKKARLKKPETQHSLISAIATYFVVEEYLKEINFNNEWTPFLPIASFLAVRRHHTNLRPALEDLKLEDTEKDSLKLQIENFYYDYLSFLPYWSTVYEKLKTLPNNGWPLRKRPLVRWFEKNKGVQPYLIEHLLYSLVLDADKHAVTIGTWLHRKNLPVDIIETFRKQKGFDKPLKKIDELRNEIYQTVTKQVESLDINCGRILSLSAPTGSGKTLTVLDFAIRLRNRIINEHHYLPRIIYCLPFLSIIDQNAKVIEEVFKSSIGKIPTSDLVLVHHHLSDYRYKKEEDTEYGADKSEILIEGWDSEIIITTFVQLFHTLFSNCNRAIRKFNKIAGSIIILDEIQSLPHQYWLLFRETVEAMAKYLNTYFILCTATQPAIFKNVQDLLGDTKKYFTSFRRNQLKINISSAVTISEFANDFAEKLIKNPKSTMVVLNTIRAAENFYHQIKETLRKTEFDLYFLSSHVIPRERLKRIEKIRKSPNKKIVISTQLVEAGVDIDLERVIRDLGPIDSINQVAGRANRNWNIHMGEVEIVLLKDESNGRYFYSYIYDPVLMENTKRILEHYSLIEEDKFLELATQYYEGIQSSLSDDESLEYLKSINTLNYEEIGKFALIKERGDMIDIFVEIDADATEIWKKYKQLMEIKDLRKRKIEFLKLRSEFYQFVISVSGIKAKDNLPPEDSGFRFIPHAQLDEFYDLETGFKTRGEVSVY